jgi:hypothetical protein
LIDRIQGFSLDLGFKNVGFVKDLNRGSSSDVGFWFFFRILIHSFYGPGSSGIGFESLIDQLTIQTYNSTAAGTRGISLNLFVAVFTVRIVEIRCGQRGSPVFFWRQRNLAYFELNTLHGEF